MVKNLNGLKKAGELLVFATITGLFLAGCSGSGGGDTAASSSTTSAVALVDKFFADGTNAGGFAYVYVKSWTVDANSVWIPATLGASKTTVTATGTNSYSITGVLNILTAAGWGVDPDPQVYYTLTDTGWVNSPSTGSAVNNLDGTITLNNGLGETSVNTLKADDLGGTAISCQLFGMSACKTPGNYPAGATDYSSTTVLTKDEYHLNAGTNAFPLQATDAAGLELNALPAADATFCVYTADYRFATVYKAILPAPASGNNYNAYYSKSCAATDITAATAATATPMLIGQRSTGNVAAPSVLTLSAGTLSLGILAAHAGKVYPGYMRPAGPQTGLRVTNKLAANALLTALGYANLP